MRIIAAVLVLLASLPALAQSQYASGSGAYVALAVLSFNRSGLQRADATVGARLAGGVDAGLRLGYESAGSGFGRAFSGGPVTFRVFGRDAAIAPITRVSLKGAPHLGDDTLGGGGFRLNL